MNGSFLKFEDGPMSKHPPVINTGFWPPAKRIGVRWLGKERGAAVVFLHEEGSLPELPEDTMIYRQVGISNFNPGIPNIFPGASYRLEKNG